jgi:hypothetical protein
MDAATKIEFTNLAAAIVKLGKQLDAIQKRLRAIEDRLPKQMDQPDS